MANTRHATKGRQRSARGGRKAGMKPDTFTNPEARGDQIYGAIYGALRPLDEVARNMEAKWGKGRLTALVSPDTASKFAMVEERLNSAIDRADVPNVQREAGIMYRGWIALDQEAMRLGAEPRPARVWEIVGDDEKLYRVTMTDEDKFGVAEGLDRAETATLVSVEELLRIYAHSKLEIVRSVKEHFPNAHITAMRPKQEAAGDGLALFETPRAQGLDDEIPF